MRLSILLLIFLFGFTPNDARKANDAYRNGEYERAAELYQLAIQADPENPRLYFNLGNTLARLGHMEEAEEAFERFKSLSNDPSLHTMADYNTGNLYSESEEFETAVTHYRNALRNSPQDPDAMHNYELAMRQLQQQQEQQDQEGDENQEQNQDQNQNQEQQDQNQDQDQDQDQNQNQEQPQQQPEPGDEQQSQQPQSDMSLEEAENVLDALEQQERELLRERQKESEEPIRNENDW